MKNKQKFYLDWRIHLLEFMQSQINVRLSSLSKVHMWLWIALAINSVASLLMFFSFYQI